MPSSNLIAGEIPNLNEKIRDLFGAKMQKLKSLTLMLWFTCMWAPVFGQIDRIKIVKQFSGAGTVEQIQSGEIVIRGRNGKTTRFLIQDKDERFVSLDGNDYIVAMPCKIDVAGRLPGNLLEPGMKIRFQGEVNRAGRTGKPIKQIEVLSDAQIPLLVDPITNPSGKKMVACDFVGIIQRFANGRAYLVVPKSNLAPNERITVSIDKDAYFDITSDNLNRVRAGDEVSNFRGQKMSNGRYVIRDITVKLTAERKAPTTTYSDSLFLKYSKLSDEPIAPRQETSDHFILYTDLSPRSARVLLEKLETMYGFLARYFRKRPSEPIECYVVSKLDNFRGKLPPVAVDKIKNRAGVTASQSFALKRGNRVKGRKTMSVVYSCDDHGVVQHEAVHAYCNMAFGTAGPVWYAEGMAEMGQYFVPNKKAIEIEPVVIEYLTTAPKKDIFDIVASGQITGDSWKAYSWRWALCYLLANNPNYAKRFRQLGVNIMMQKQDAFDSAFENQLKRIALEYDQFISNFDNGYRADLCVWQWVDQPKAINSKSSASVKAKYGWQASGLNMKKGEFYDFVCPKLKDKNGDRRAQKWKIDSNNQLTPDGDSNGNGQLIGAILSDFKLSDEFEIGSKKIGFAAPMSGQLYLRCKDKWNSISDNEGELKVYVRRNPGSDR